MSRTPIHPGEILSDESRELGMSAAGLARCLPVPANRITQILRGQRDITADTALRLGRWFGTGPQLWLNLQQAYELDLARQQLGEEIEQIAPRITNPSCHLWNGHELLRSNTDNANTNPYEGRSPWTKKL